MPESEEMGEMSFWDHLDALRWTLMRSVVALILFAILFYCFMPYLFDHVILAPCRGDFVFYEWLRMLGAQIPFFPDFGNEAYEVKIVNITLASQFFIHISTSFSFAVVAAFPYLIFEVWRFISPALYENELKKARWVLVFGTIMFFCGVALGYFMIFPMTLRFLADYNLSAYIVNQVSLDSYMDNFLMMIFAMGIIFELPLLSWFLSQIGLVRKSFFRTYRRHAFVACFILAAVITPSGDPFTMTAVGLPLYLLYELSIFLVKADKPAEEEEEEEETALDRTNNEV